MTTNNVKNNWVPVLVAAIGIIGSIITAYITAQARTVATLATYAADIENLEKSTERLASEIKTIQDRLNPAGENIASILEKSENLGSTVSNVATRTDQLERMVAELTNSFKNVLPSIQNEISSLKRVDPRIDACNSILQRSQAQIVPTLAMTRAEAQADRMQAMKDYQDAGCPNILSTND